MQVANTSRDQLRIVNNHCSPGEGPIASGAHYLIPAYCCCPARHTTYVVIPSNFPGVAQTFMRSPHEGRSLHLFWSPLSLQCLAHCRHSGYTCWWHEWEMPRFLIQLFFNTVWPNRARAGQRCPAEIQITRMTVLSPFLFSRVSSATTLGISF